MMSSRSKEKIIEIMKFVFNFITIIIIPIKINFIQIEQVNFYRFSTNTNKLVVSNFMYLYRSNAKDTTNFITIELISFY